MTTWRLSDARDLSRTSVRELVAAFETCKLPREEWTHAAHLIVGLWYVLNHGQERALALMSAGIQRYNEASGRSEREKKGYSAQATRDWIQRIAEFSRRHAGDSPEGTLFRRILTSSLASKDGETTLAGTLTVPDPEPAEGPGDVTRLLQGGLKDDANVHELFRLVYEELCAIAGRRMRAESPQHTLQATALVHEAYVRLVRDEHMRWESRRHFYGAAARAMRRVLVDHARYVRAERRMNRGARMSLSAAELALRDDPQRVVEVDELLEKLGRHDPRSAEVVHLRLFAGLTLEETAEALDLSIRTVTREWTYARAWLRDRLR